jgi:hypothetical protein
MRDISENVVEKSETRFMFNNVVTEIRAVCEKMWKNVLGPERPQRTIWRMRTAFRITEARTTHSEYVRLSAFPLQQWLYERVSGLRYTYISCLVFNMSI